MDNLVITVVCNQAGATGSVASVASRQAVELANNGARVTLVSQSFPPLLDARINRVCVSPPTFNYLHRFCHVPNELAFVLSARRWLMSNVRSEKCRFILCHGHASACLAARPAKSQFQIPYGVVTHGDIFQRPPGTYDRRLTAFYQAVTPPAYRDADLVVAISPYMAECARKGGARASAVECIPNGIEPVEIGLSNNMPPRAATADGVLRLLFVGALTEIKGADTLLSACRIAKGLGLKFQLRIIGDGPHRQSLTRQLSDLELQDNVEIRGWVKRGELGGHYRWADITCVPSLEEPLGVVVLESLIAGTPVIGSEVGGILSMIEHGKNGLLTPANQPEALAKAIDSLGRSPARLEALRSQAVLSVWPRFSWESSGGRLFQAIAARTR